MGRNVSALKTPEVNRTLVLINSEHGKHNMPRSETKDTALSKHPYRKVSKPGFTMTVQYHV